MHVFLSSCMQVRRMQHSTTIFHAMSDETTWCCMQSPGRRSSPLFFVCVGGMTLYVALSLWFFWVWSKRQVEVWSGNTGEEFIEMFQLMVHQHGVIHWFFGVTAFVGSSVPMFLTISTVRCSPKRLKLNFRRMRSAIASVFAFIEMIPCHCHRQQAGPREPWSSKIAAGRLLLNWRCLAWNFRFCNHQRYGKCSCFAWQFGGQPSPKH